MKAPAEGDLGMKGVSRIVGEARGTEGVSRPLYEALRELLCSSCGASIPEGALFTRHGAGAVAPPIHPRCAECAPFELSRAGRSVLIDALLTPEGGEFVRDAPDRDKKRVVEERLGPALARSRKRRQSP